MATFKTRARAVDMLGRQQIAGVPTAISELFKNAHDAYADRVEVDYYRTDRLLILRDDGVGMTEREFLDRWLTIGTESKVSTRTGIGPPPIDKGKSRRAILGEKGIGRLAIAAIGPQVLVLSRAERATQEESALIAAFIHWGLFEVPGVDLDEIDVPVQAFAAGALPTKADISRMVSGVELTLERITDRIEAEEAEKIHTDLAAMRALDPAEIEAYLPELDLRSKRGTHFFLPSAYPTLEADIERGSGEDASSLEKLLLGFTNTMTPGHALPVIDTAFRDHITDELSEDLVDKERFFSPDEFRNADHHISGRFDEFGQFVGTVAVYGEEHADYQVAWPKSQGVRTRCGPFEIHLAAVQPQVHATTLPPEPHQRLLAKTRRFGGLYIYRDGIRVLPYGDVDYDWLEIEKRRTLQAAYYYFSHRNLFGAILLSNAQNGQLNEKAGREGFRENTAYRQLRSILKNFLRQVAGDFFREDGTYAQTYQEHKGELKRQHDALKRREATVTGRRKELVSSLTAFFEALEKDEPRTLALELAERVEQELKGLESVEDPGEAATQFLETEARARDSLRRLEEGYRITRPRGIGLGRKILREYEDYQIAYEGLQRDVFAGVRDLIEGEVSNAVARSRTDLDRRMRIQRSLEDLGAQARRESRAARAETQEQLKIVHKEIRAATQASLMEVDAAVTSTLANFASTDLREVQPDALVALRNELESKILAARERTAAFLAYVRSQLDAIDVSGVLGHIDQIEAIEERNIELEARAEYDLQLAQLGMAVDIINHEFEASVRAIRNGLRRLKAWADVNDALQSVYDDLRASFDHLDGYLTLFTPLHRRLNRHKVTISGGDIAKYLRDLFGPRFQRHGIDLRVEPGFARWSVVGFPSSFYPAFVNLADNAIYWMAERQRGDRTISLDAEGSSAFVSNTGPSIPVRRHAVIFDQGVSFKPAGRGLGLFISREALRGVDYDLDLIPPLPGMGVTFQIAPQEKDE